MAQSVGPSMILSHYSPRILRLSFTKSTLLRHRSLSYSRNRSIPDIYHSVFQSILYHTIFHDQWLHQSVHQWSLLSHSSPRIPRMSFTKSINLSNRLLCLYQSIICSTICHILLQDQWLNQSVHQWSFRITFREFFACNSRHRSI